MGGNELYSERLATELHQRGHDVTVYTTVADGERNTPFDVREFQNAVPEEFGYFAWPGIFRPKILRELRSFDAVHAVNASMFSAVVGAIAKTLSGSTRTVLTTTYHSPRVQTHQTLKRIYDQFLLQRVLEQYDRLIVSSKFELQELDRSFDLSDCQIDRLDIPPITDTEPLKMNGPNNTAESTEILYVGRLDSHKGVNELLQAIEQLRVSGGSVHCIVVGEQERWYEWPDEIADIVDQNEEAFEFTGFISEQELADTYATSDALVLPSEYETYGQVVVEALNYGTPVVMTPVGIGPERIEDGYNGVIYDPNEANSLVNALQQIRKDDGERLNKNAKESVSDLSWTEVVNHLENIYCGE